MKELHYKIHRLTHFHFWKLEFRLLLDMIFGHKLIDAKSDLEGCVFCLRCKTFYFLKASILTVQQEGNA